jgi:lipopolysaccharide transport system ATP-binding protein
MGLQMSSKLALKIENLSKYYRIYDTPLQRMRELLFGGRHHDMISALHPASFNIKHGEVLGILGRNGAGKSTLLQMIAGTLTPTSGTVEADGKITALLELGSGFNPDFTGRENVFLYGSILGLTKAQVKERLQNILEFADIGEFVDRPLKTYSSGMGVRLAFATVVGLEPEIIIVDEALAVGDAVFQLKCMRLINSLKEKGKTFILVSHSVPQIVSFCTRALVIEGGNVIFDGEPKDAAHIYKSTLFPGERERIVKKLEQEKQALEQSDNFEDDKLNLTVAVVQNSKATNKKSRLAEDEIVSFVGDASEYRFGNGSAKIKRIEIVGRENNIARVFISHECVRLRIFVNAEREISYPVYGFRIRNANGLDIYIKNTLTDKIQVQPICPNKLHKVEFVFNLSLVGGEYFVSAGLSENVGEELIPLDRRMDVLQISVVSTDSSTGIANLESSFSDHKEVKTI